MGEHFTWPSLLVGHDWDPTFTASVVMVMLLAWAAVGLKQLRAASDPVIPDATLTARNMAEIFVEWFIGFTASILGPKGRSYIAIYGSFFLFILVANLCGLIPGISPPTSTFTITFALGLTSFLAYNYYGFQQKGVGYLKHFLGPIWWLAFLMLPLELVDNFVRPASLALRLFGNMYGDHLVLGIFTDLTKLVIPVVFLGLGSFVSLIQAFVFTILGLVYLSLAIEDHGHGDEHHEGEHAHAHAAHH